MSAAEPDWLELRVPFDEAAREYALPLLDQAASALLTPAMPEDQLSEAELAEAQPSGAELTTADLAGADLAGADLTDGAKRPLVVIDIGAGTGNSMRWFDAHLTKRLPGRALQWVLVDADAVALEIAADRFGTAVRTVSAPISSLPDIAAEALAEVSPGDVTDGQSWQRCELLITGSALLDVLTPDDMAAIVETLHRFSGVGLFLLSISGQWQLSPPHPADDALDEAFGRHQRRESRLGTQAVPVLEAEAHSFGAHVETSASPWCLEAPRDSEFLTRFLTERVAAAVEEDPGLTEAGRSWLQDRLQRMETKPDENQDARGGNRSVGLSVVVDHIDVLIDASARQGGPAAQHVQKVDQLSQASSEPNR